MLAIKRGLEAFVTNLVPPHGHANKYEISNILQLSRELLPDYNAVYALPEEQKQGSANLDIQVPTPV